MPRIIYDIPDWGYDLASYRKHKYKRSLQEDLTYIDSLRGYSLYMYDSNGQYSKHFVLLDHTNETIKYKSMLMDTMHNGKFSQALVWRDKDDDALKGISSQIIVDYYLDQLTYTVNQNRLFHHINCVQYYMNQNSSPDYYQSSHAIIFGHVMIEYHPNITS